MGTNFYLEVNPCPTCNRPQEELHIGRSSGGWCFALHVIPERDINDLPDWQRLFAQQGTKIRDEYGSYHSIKDMLDTITNRSNTKPRMPSTFDPCSNEQWYANNQAKPSRVQTT